MNIYQKLMTCRIGLKQSALKKTGHNTYSNYDYYELEDFLPLGLELLDKVQLCTTFTVDTTARLTLIDCEKPEDSIVFESPLTEIPNLKACHLIQGLGAVHSYLRRYLYINLFELTEKDTVDAGKKDDAQKITNVQKNNSQDESEPIAETQKKLWNMLLEMNSNDNTKALNALESYSAFESNGKTIKGFRKFDGISEKRIRTTYGKVKKDYETKKSA